MATLADIAAMGDARSREAAYVAFIDQAVARSDAAALTATIDALVNEVTPFSISRPSLRHLGKALNRIESNLVVETLCQHGIAAIAARGVDHFEAEDVEFRRPMFAVHMADEDYLRAAGVLAQARVEGPVFDDRARAETYVKVAQAYVKGGDEVAADRFLKRANDYVYTVGDWTLMVQFKTLYAVLLDSKRRFQEAAARYIEVLATAGDRAEEGEVLHFLEKAAICAVLAPAGPQRTRVLGTLARDPRIEGIRPPVANLLTRVFHERLVPLDSVSAFEGCLEAHQKAVTADGTSVTARALVEHNLRAASRLYSSISFDRLGELLGVPPASAERTAARMVAERRLAASLDGVGGFLDFTGGSGGGLTEAPGGGGVGTAAGEAAGAASAAGTSGGQWNGAIRGMLEGLTAAVEAVVARHPHLALT